jgi:hypothetical protein
MNRDEAKYILRSYHLNGWDADDPQFQHALEMLRHDPELAEWFAEEQAIDTKLSEKFLAFPVPPDLKSQVLAARKIIPLRVWWRTTRWLSSAAAAFVLVATLAVFLAVSSEKREFVEFRNYVAETAATLDHLDLHSADLVQIRGWLESHRAPEDFVLPASLNGRPSIGCRVFDWTGGKVSLICFQLENKKVAHLFVVDRSKLTKMAPGETPQFQTSVNGMATASWADDSRIYIVAMKRGEQDLKELLL